MLLKDRKDTNYKVVEYRKLFIELAKDGSWYNVYELTPIFKSKATILVGSTADGSFTLDYVKEQIDIAIKDLVDVICSKMYGT